MGTRNKEEQSGGTDQQKSRVPTWLGRFGGAIFIYAVKVLANLDCYILLRLHNIDGQSTVPQLCSYLDGKALFLERPIAVVKVS